VPEFIATETNIAYWNRLAYLIVIPLWAVNVYQNAMEPIPDSTTRDSGSNTAAAGTLDMAAGLIANRQPARRTALGLRMAQEMSGGTFAALALPVDENADSLTFVSNLPAGIDGGAHGWTMSLSGNPALRTALGQESPVVLRADGLGARQFHALRQATQIETGRALLLTPLPMNDGKHGLLLVDGSSKDTAWTDREIASLKSLAHFLGQALSNSQERATGYVESPSPESPSPEATVPAAIVIDKALLRNVEAERDELRAALDQANTARLLAENNALAAQKQARYLAAALRVAQAPAAAKPAAGAGPASGAETEQNHE
jgi:hypothetical protein